jgi:hypothetical protein
LKTQIHVQCLLEFLKNGISLSQRHYIEDIDAACYLDRPDIFDAVLMVSQSELLFFTHRHFAFCEETRKSKSEPAFSF